MQCSDWILFSSMSTKILLKSFMIARPGVGYLHHEQILKGDLIYVFRNYLLSFQHLS